MKYKTLQDALKEIKPQAKEDDVKSYFVNIMLDFIELYEHQIRRIIKYDESFELELYKDIFIRITRYYYQKSVTIGEEKIISGTFVPKNEGFPLDYYVLASKSDGFNTINWETQKEEFMQNYTEIINSFVERNRIDG